MAVLTSAEVNEQVGLSYIRGTYKVALTSSVTNYTSALSLATVVADEVPAGNGGYARLSYTYSNADLLAFSTNGQPLAEKVATFFHDGSSVDMIFNAVVILRDVSGTLTVVGYQQLSDDVVLSAGNSAKININLLQGVG